jgi:hypothetical protein
MALDNSIKPHHWITTIIGAFLGIMGGYNIGGIGGAILGIIVGGGIGFCILEILAFILVWAIAIGLGILGILLIYWFFKYLWGARL